MWSAVDIVGGMKGASGSDKLPCGGPMISWED